MAPETTTINIIDTVGINPNCQMQQIEHQVIRKTKVVPIKRSENFAKIPPASNAQVTFGKLPQTIWLWRKVM